MQFFFFDLTNFNLSPDLLHQQPRFKSNNSIPKNPTFRAKERARKRRGERGERFEGKDAFGMERIEEKEETLIIKLDKKMKKRIIFFFLEKKTEIQKYLLMGALCTS